MGKPTGFMEYQRELPTDPPPAERVKDWKEFHQHCPEERRKIDRAAKYHHMKRATFAKAALMAYLDRVFVLPSDETVRSLELGVRRIASNINQIARRVNTRRTVEHSDVAEVNRFLTDLEGLISQAFRAPPDVLSLVEQALEQAPHLAGPLRRLLDKHTPAR